MGKLPVISLQVLTEEKNKTLEGYIKIHGPHNFDIFPDLILPYFQNLLCARCLL